MDVVRSCYSSRWNFPDVGQVRGYYFFCDPDTPFYPDWHFFGSRNWHKGDGTPWPQFGELENTKHVWRDGSFPTLKPEPVVVGSAGGISGDSRCTVSAPTFLLFGIDIRCWPHGVPFISPSIGGDLAGGSGTHVVAFTPAAAGGDLAGGIFAAIAGWIRAGSSLEAIGGQTLTSAGFSRDGAGGGKTGGSSTFVYHVEAIAQGGDKAGSFMSHVYHAGRIGQGGSKTGGTATNSHHP